ncbi:hypothetical protein INT45_001210, partial [Circinella minor]
NNNDYYVENNNHDTMISDSTGSDSVRRNFDNQDEAFYHKEDIQQQQHEQNTIKETKKKKEDNAIADGGCAGWLVVLGGVLVQFITIGIGVMQAYYEQHVFSNDGSNIRFQLGFVSSCLFASLNGLGAVFQILRSILGTRIVLVIGTLFLSTGLITAGFSTQIWHLYITQGICFGTGACFMYMTLTIIVPQYFCRKRNLAFGIIAAGTGIGGAVIPFIMTTINKTLGSGWTYRILGFVSIIFNVIICLVVKGPRYQQQTKIERCTKKLNDIFDFQVLKNPNFVLWCLAATVQLAVYASPFFIIPTYATFYGLSDSHGSSLVTVGNIMNFFGRIICGLLADKFGPINMNIFFSSISALSCFLIWTFADNYGMMMTFMVIFGFVGGIYFTLMPTITVTILGVEKLPTGISIVLLCNVISILFTNMVSAIDSNSTSPQPFMTYKMFTGVGFSFVVIIMIWIKFRINKKIDVKV